MYSIIARILYAHKQEGRHPYDTSIPLCLYDSGGPCFLVVLFFGGIKPPTEGMYMSLIQISNLTFAYEESFDTIFENMSLQIDTSWTLQGITAAARPPF